MVGLEDGGLQIRVRRVGKQPGMNLRAISVSRDGKWMVCGTRDEGASVWDAELHEKVIDVEGTKTVYAVDVSPDSTRLAMATNSSVSRPSQPQHGQSLRFRG